MLYSLQLRSVNNNNNNNVFVVFVTIVIDRSIDPLTSSWRSPPDETAKRTFVTIYIFYIIDFLQNALELFLTQLLSLSLH